MGKYEIAIYTSPKVETILKKEIDEIGQGLIIARGEGHLRWVKGEELKGIQWHINNRKRCKNEGEINLIIGHYLPNGEISISEIITKE